MSYTIKILGLLLVVAVLEVGCKKEDPPCDDPTNQACPNYDPCYTIKPVSAGFVAKRISNALWIVPDGMPKDTFFSGGRVAFFAAEQDNPNTRYEWRIGSDNRTWEESSVVLNFSTQDVLGQCVPVRLITNREDACLSVEEQVDTVERQICFIPDEPSLNPVWGRFRGATEDAPDEVYELEVYLDSNIHSPNLDPYIANLDNRGCIGRFTEGSTSYRQLRYELGPFDYSSECTMPAGAAYDRTAIRDLNLRVFPNVDSIVIDYKILAGFPWAAMTEIGSKRFKGIRVN